jgi:hypothetical protein
VISTHFYEDKVPFNAVRGIAEALSEMEAKLEALQPSRYPQPLFEHSRQLEAEGQCEEGHLPLAF